MPVIASVFKANDERNANCKRAGTKAPPIARLARELPDYYRNGEFSLNEYCARTRVLCSEHFGNREEIERTDHCSCTFLCRKNKENKRTAKSELPTFRR